MSEVFQKKIDYLKSKCKEAEEKFDQGEGFDDKGAAFLMDIKRRGSGNIDDVEITPGLHGEIVMFDTTGDRIIVSVLCSDFHKWLKSMNIS